MLKKFWLGCEAQVGETIVENCGLASLRDRAAAQAIDIMIGTFAIWLLLMFVTPRCAGIAFSSGHLSTSNDPFVVGSEVALMSIVIYYLLMESLLGATVGKMLCRLEVRREGKQHCGVASALIRTLTRPLDWVLGPIVIGWTRKKQRIGDMIGCTIVTRQLRSVQSFTAVSGKEMPATRAGWEVRTKAALIDFGLLAFSTCAILYGLGSLRLSPTAQLTLRPRNIMVIGEWLFFYFVLSEALVGGTLGKLLSSLRVVQMNGHPCGFAEATTRALWRILDLATLGLLPFCFVRFGKSGRHPGEFLADTSVREEPTPRLVVLWTIFIFLFPTALIASYPYWKQIL